MMEDTAVKEGIFVSSPITKKSKHSAIQELSSTKENQSGS
jgi:hypothetical protein